MSMFQVPDHSQTDGVSQAKKRDLESRRRQGCDISAIAFVTQKARMHTTRKRIRRNAGQCLSKTGCFALKQSLGES